MILIGSLLSGFLFSLHVAYYCRPIFGASWQKPTEIGKPLNTPMSLLKISTSVIVAQELLQLSLLLSYLNELSI